MADGSAVEHKAVTEVAPKKPNVIFVLADDLGYGDVGWTVQNKRKAEGKDCWIETPHMDQMAAEGCTMTAHYAACPVCAPSRSPEKPNPQAKDADALAVVRFSFT